MSTKNNQFKTLYHFLGIGSKSNVSHILNYIEYLHLMQLHEAMSATTFNTDSKKSSKSFPRALHFQMGCTKWQWKV